MRKYSKPYEEKRTLYQQLVDNNWNLTYEQVYDLRKEEDIDRLDIDSEDASSYVQEFGLNYTVDARHWSTVIKGDHITDMVTVTWKFWKNE